MPDTASPQLAEFPEDWERALAIMAHPDDLEYGGAAAIARWTGQGKRVAYVPEMVRALIQGLIDGGIDPDDVAAQVVDAIRTGRFWVLTHPATVESARKRWDAIAGDEQPVLWNVTAG